MKVPVPAASSLHFLAGILAGAGINLITSVATGPEGDVGAGEIALDSGLWVLAAAFLTWAAQVLQHGERDADLYMNVHFSDEERHEIREQSERAAWRRARIPVVLTVLSLAGAVVFLPRFIPWGGPH
jgi:hypothetical protein